MIIVLWPNWSRMNQVMNKLAICFGLCFLLSVSVFAQQATVISEKANMRERASSSSKVVMVLSHGAEVEVVQSLLPWYQIRYGGQTGWVHGNTIKLLERSLDDTEDISITLTEPSEIKIPEIADWQMFDDIQSATLYHYPAKIRRSERAVHVWLKMVPKKLSAYRKKPGVSKEFAYSLQYMTINCDEETWALDNEISYNSKGESIPARNGSAFFYGPIPPGSKAENWMRRLCR